MLAAVPQWVKIAGKNGFNLGTDRGKEVVEQSMEQVDAIIAHLDAHFVGAGFVFDGDTNEKNAPFSQVIKELIVRNRVVVCFGTQESEEVTLGNKVGPRFEVWGDLVSHNFVKSWTTDMPRAPKTCAPCYERPNFVYGLLDYMFTKETVTRNAVAGTVFVNSALPDYQLRADGKSLTTGYAELVHLLKEPSKDNKAYANFAHDLVPKTPWARRRRAPRRGRQRQDRAVGHGRQAAGPAPAPAHARGRRRRGAPQGGGGAPKGRGRGKGGGGGGGGGAPARLGAAAAAPKPVLKTSNTSDRKVPILAAATGVSFLKSTGRCLLEFLCPEGGL